MGVNQPPGLLRSRNLADLSSASLARAALGMAALTNFGPGASPMAVGNGRTMVIPANPSNAGDTVNNSLNSRFLYFAPLLSGISDIQVALPGWATTAGNGPETDLPTPYVGWAALEYPLGSPQRLFWSGGGQSMNVSVGRNLPFSLPNTTFIPAGAEFAIKLYATWTAGSWWNATYAGYGVNPEWTNVGVGLSDHTLDTTVLTQTTGGSSFTPLVYGRYQKAIPVIGVIGDSIGNGGTDLTDPVTLSNFWGRGLRNHLPMLNQSTGGFTVGEYLLRNEGMNLGFRLPAGSSTITHLIMEMGTNDVFAGTSLATMQANLQAAINPFLARSVKVYVCTLLPRTTSADGWISTNQGWIESAWETVRLGYNAWLRTNYASLGITGVIDMCAAVDPNNTGKWGFDPGLTYVPTSQGACFATVAGGQVATIFRGIGYAGAGYPASVSNIPLTTYPYPGQTGAGATGLATSNSSGQIISAAMSTPGGNYSDVPMVNILGPWTLDGTHPTSRGTNEIIYRAPIVTAAGTTIGYGPGIFTL